MTVIDIVGIRATGFHGVFPEEKRAGQEFVVDVRLGLARARERDDLESTVDYGLVGQLVHDHIAGPPVDLIETLAAGIADAIAALPMVEWAEVKVHKPQAPMPVPFDDVSVTIRRGARG
jgi:dihydroneopterin aldolase